MFKKNESRDEYILRRMKEESSLEKQVGGNHYSRYKIQPVDFIIANKLDWCESNVIKYITRWRNKNGVEDLRKAAHYIEMLIERELNESSRG